MNWQNCCRGRKSCPHIAVVGNVVHIRDDHGGEIKLTLDEFQSVQWKLTEVISARLPVRTPGIRYVE